MLWGGKKNGKPVTSWIVQTKKRGRRAQMTGGTTPGGEMKYSAQELVVDRVVGLRGVCVAEAVQEAVELGQLIRRHL